MHARHRTVTPRRAQPGSGGGCRCTILSRPRRHTTHACKPSQMPQARTARSAALRSPSPMRTARRAAAAWTRRSAQASHRPAAAAASARKVPLRTAGRPHAPCRATPCCLMHGRAARAFWIISSSVRTTSLRPRHHPQESFHMHCWSLSAITRHARGDAHATHDAMHASRAYAHVPLAHMGTAEQASSGPFTARCLQALTRSARSTSTAA